MRFQLEAVIEEIRRRKRGGEEVVHVDSDTLGLLEKAILQWRGAQPDASTPKRTTASPEVALQVRKPTPSAQISSPAIPSPPTISLPEGTDEERWQWLRQQVLHDPVCRARVRPGKQVVFGVGAVPAKVCFIGEAPGAEEEIQGEPFVGPAGQLLTKIIRAAGWERDSVYISNIMNWRPEMPTEYGNRPPTADEMAYCLPYLRAQLEIVRPAVIVALGGTAIAGLLGKPDSKSVKVGQIRGSWLEFAGIPVVPTYHPSYLLRNQTNRAKRMVWEDFLRVMEKTGMPISDKQQQYFL